MHRLARTIQRKYFAPPEICESSTGATKSRKLRKGSGVEGDRCVATKIKTQTT